MTPEFARAENGRILMHSSCGWGEESRLYATVRLMTLEQANPTTHRAQIAELRQALKEAK